MSEHTNKKIVAKAGGTSNRDADAIRQTLEVTEQADILVVSAPAGVTNDLLEIRTAYENTGELSEKATGGIVSRYSDIIIGLGKDTLPKLPKNWVDRLPPRIAQAVSQDRDAASIMGEQLMAEVYEGMGFIRLDPGRSPHNLGSNENAWRGWLGKAYVQGQKHILGGNMTLVNGRLATFGRGGSDTTSGFASYGIKADLNLNFTDDSALSADPRLIQPKNRLNRLAHLLYEEGRELGRNGTGLVHPAAMVPLMKGNIPTEIRSTFDPQASPTVLDNDNERAKHRAGAVVALSLMENVTIHRVHEAGMAEANDRLTAFGVALSESNITLIDSQGDGVDAQKYFVGTGQAEEAVNALSETTTGIIESSGNLSLITLVGYRLKNKQLDNIGELASDSGLLREVWQNEGHDLSTGRHSLRISVRPEEAHSVLNSLHRTFIENS